MTLAYTWGKKVPGGEKKKRKYQEVLTVNAKVLRWDCALHIQELANVTE